MGNILNVFVTRIVLFLTVFASISVIFLMTLPERASPIDPFEPYADIMPGQSLDTGLEYGFKCQFVFSTESCYLTPETGIFSNIEVRITMNTGRITRVMFKMREKTLTFGDLALLWGKPEIAVYAGIANFRWRDRRIVAIPKTYNGHFSYWLPITFVAFEVDG